MAAVSQAFHETPDRRGSVIGILPSGDDPGRPPPGYPNPWVEIPIHTHLPHSGTRGTEPLSRNHINILSSDVIVALPGSAGTCSEVELALSYGRPIVGFLNSREEIDGLPDQVPLRETLDDVGAFIRSHLNALIVR